MRLRCATPPRLPHTRPPLPLTPNLTLALRLPDPAATAVASVVRDSTGVTVTGRDGSQGRFDDVVFACGAEAALRLIHEPDWAERRFLGNVTYYDDTIVTHEDGEYMREHYDVSVCAVASGSARAC